MLNKTLLTLMMATTIATITGCSSHSSGSSNSTTTTPVVTNDNGNDTGNGTKNDNPKNTKATSGYRVTAKTTKKNPTTEMLAVTDDGDGDLNTISINGRNITLVPSGISAGNFVSINGNITSGTKYQYTKFGVDNNKTNPWSVFAQGVATTDMPTKGSATYKGGAVGSSNAIEGFTRGESTVNVNFANKSLTGQLSNWKNTKMQDISFDATINGNKFSKTGTTEVSGMFYGNNAAELGGVISQDKNSSQNTVASFGAIKQ